MQQRNVTNEQWARRKPVLPPQKPKTGRINLNHGRMINGIVWILRTGAPWDDVPRRDGQRGTVRSRAYRWRKKGIWNRSFAAGQAQAAAHNHLDWPIHCVDRTVIRAHQPAAGAKGSDPETEARGRRQGGFHHTAAPRRGPRHATALGPAARPSTRAPSVRAAAGAEGRSADAARATAAPTQSRGGRPRVPHPPHPSLAATPWHWDHHSAHAPRAPPRAVRHGALQAAGHGRAPDQPPEAIPA
jgi:transposase